MFIKKFILKISVQYMFIYRQLFSSKNILTKFGKCKPHNNEISGLFMKTFPRRFILHDQQFLLIYCQKQVLRSNKFSDSFKYYPHIINVFVLHTSIFIKLYFTQFSYL